MSNNKQQRPTVVNQQQQQQQVVYSKIIKDSFNAAVKEMTEAPVSANEMLLEKYTKDAIVMMKKAYEATQLPTEETLRDLLVPSGFISETVFERFVMALKFAKGDVSVTHEVQPGVTETITLHTAKNESVMTATAAPQQTQSSVSELERHKAVLRETIASAERIKKEAELELSGMEKNNHIEPKVQSMFGITAESAESICKKLDAILAKRQLLAA